MDEKETRILEAAYKLFNQHGFRKVTMSDIAEASAMSRPSLYAAFPNKEAVFGAIGARHLERADLETGAALAKAPTLAARLAKLFAIWIVDPFASVIDSPAGLDLLGNASTYAPEATNAIYVAFEAHLVAALEPELKGKRGGLSAADLAHIMTLATRGLKATTATVDELRRMTDGLIAMALATALRR